MGSQHLLLRFIDGKQVFVFGAETGEVTGVTVYARNGVEPVSREAGTVRLPPLVWVADAAGRYRDCKGLARVVGQAMTAGGPSGFGRSARCELG